MGRDFFSNPRPSTHTREDVKNNQFPCLYKFSLNTGNSIVIAKVKE